METPVPVPDTLLRFVSLRTPRIPKAPIPTNPNVHTHQTVYGTLTAAEMATIVSNGNILYTDLETLQGNPATTQEDYLNTVQAFKETSLYYGDNSSVAYTLLHKLIYAESYLQTLSEELDLATFTANLETILGSTITDIVTNGSYKEARVRLWDSFFALLIEDERNGNLDEVIKVIKLTGLIERIYNADPTIANSEDARKALGNAVLFPPVIEKVLNPEDEQNYTVDQVTSPALAQQEMDKAELDAGMARLKDLRYILNELEAVQSITAGIRARFKEIGGGFNNDFNGDFPQATSAQVVGHEKIQRVLNNVTAKTQAELAAMGFAATDTATDFDEVVELVRMQVTQQQQTVNDRFPKPKQIIPIGGAFISYSKGCFNYKPKSPCEANIAPPMRLSTGIFQSGGWADLLVLEQELLKYDLGEIAHIENVLKGEKKGRKHERLDRREETLTFETEYTKEEEKETQTTERFSLEKETSKVVEQDLSVDAGVSVTASYGPVSIDSSLDFGYSNTSTEANRSASRYAKEVTNRALSRVIEKVREAKTVTTVHQIIETNEHSFDNTSQPEGEAVGDHVSGVYRWVDKYYKARVKNYGKRYMIEFIVPEPAAFYIFSQANKPTSDDSMDEPIHWNTFLTSSKDLDESNYQMIAALMGADGITPPPPKWQTYSAHGKNSDALHTSETPKYASEVGSITIPDGYQAKWAYSGIRLGGDATIDGVPRKADGHFGYNYFYTDQTHNEIGDVNFNGYTEPMANETGSVPYAITFHATLYAFTIEIHCERTTEHMAAWQLKTFNAIVEAYNRKVAEYNEWKNAKAIQQGVTISGKNPGINREIEKGELKKHCLSIFTGQRFEFFNAMKNRQVTEGYPEIDLQALPEQAKYIQFFEQAFEWNNSVYRFYPYFWGKKPNWLVTSNMYDTDPLFTKFLQAGAARVLVPVRPGYEAALAYYMKSGGKVFNGMNAPGPEDPLYVSIIEELKEDANAETGYTVDDEWVVKVPTQLVYLQPMNPALNPPQIPLEFTP